MNSLRSIRRRRFTKKLCLKISSYSHGNTFVRKWLQHRCFSVNIAKVLKHLFWKTSGKDCFCLLHIKTMNGVILWYIFTLQCYFIWLCGLFFSLLFYFLFSVQSTTMWSIEVNLSVFVIKRWSCLQFCF